MPNYKSHPVLSVRMPPEVLDALRERAAREGRTVSGEVVYLVRDRLASAPRPAARPITGWLKGAKTPAALSEFHEGRAVSSATLMRSVRKKARRR